MPREEIIEHFETAEDLVDALSRRNKRWKRGARSWVFRGHADASWPLLPAALRTPCPVTDHPDRPKVPYNRSADQVRQEVEEVWQFINEADYYGLLIPGDASRVMRRMDQDRKNIAKGIHLDRFPSVETVEAYALAQHHGIPTRLLDWTRDPLTAVYFAATEAARALFDGRDIKRLGIWCFCGNVLESIDQTAKEKILLMCPPKAPNKNLLAQNGVFSLHIHLINGEEPPKIVPFDALVEALCDSAAPHLSWLWEDKSPIRLFTLPTTRVYELLSILNDEDVTAAKLFPGYDGVVRTLQDNMHLWTTPKRPTQKVEGE